MGADGPVTFAALFGGKAETLAVYNYMFGPQRTAPVRCARRCSLPGTARCPT